MATLESNNFDNDASPLVNALSRHMALYYGSKVGIKVDSKEKEDIENIKESNDAQKSFKI